MTESTAERKLLKILKPQFILTGFSQAAGVRTYAFEGVLDGKRAPYTVEVELARIGGYGIRIQDLPLLCRDLLQQLPEAEELSAFVFTEQLMRTHAEKVATAREEAEQKKKQPRHIAGASAGAAWRTGFRTES